MAIYLHEGDLPEGLLTSGPIAVDTETLGLVPHRDRLCLVQLSDGNGDEHLVRFRPGEYNAPNLKRVLENPEQLKLFHFARFDCAALRRHLGVTVAPVICTKVASKLVRTFTDRHGLKDLCKELLGVEISKQQQSSDWGAPDLSAEQLAYAASDVLYLHAIWAKLEGLLHREGRMALAEACFRFLPARGELDLLGYEEPDILSH